MTKSIKAIIISLFISLVIAGSVVFPFSHSDFVSEKISWLKIAFQTIKNELMVLAQYFYPHYPQRIMYLVSEMSLASEELVSLNEGLLEEMQKCDCQNAQSQCVSGGSDWLSIGTECNPYDVFGDPCQNREEIEEKQSEIKETIDQISYLRNLLLKEKETSLEEELETLDPEVDEQLRNEIDEILAESEEILSPANANLLLPADCSSDTCSAECQAGGIVTAACIQIGTGPQEQIKLKFKIGVKLDDLDLGQIGIKNINLGLPEEIHVPKIGDLSITIPSQAITLTFPETTIAELQSQGLDLSSQSVNLNNQFSLPEIPSLNLSCPTPTSLSSSYQCSTEQSIQQVESIENRWYFQTFSYLSEKCQELPDMQGELWLPEEAADCFNPEELPSTIVEECESAWDSYCDPVTPGPEPLQVCKDIRYSCEFNSELAAAVQCQNLFTQENEPIPSSCEFFIVSNGTTYVEYSEDFDPVNTLETKCDKLEDEGRLDPPEPCKILPLFTDVIKEPDQEQYSSGNNTCASQEIGDFPSSMLSCPFNPPTLPKITFPKIVVPDIIMPSFKIWPILQVKLPNFIFEDLIIPDWELCNLDECMNIFPFLNFQSAQLGLPSLDISFKIPDLEILFQGIPIKVLLPDISIQFQLPTFPFNLPQLPELNLGKLITLELQMPQIQLPNPQITFSFSGIDLSAIYSLIYTYILNALDIPDSDFCVGIGISLPFFSITFPDYYFGWPGFPELPEIPYCKDLRAFCQNLKTPLKEVTDKVKEIEDIFNETVLTQIQEMLNQLSELVNDEINGQIDLILQEYSEIIRQKIKEHLEMVMANINVYLDPVTGKLKIPPITITLPEKKIPIPLDDMVDLPDTITIPWPEELKKINLSISINYDLPKIPLDKLSYEKELTIPGPGFQPRTFSFTLSGLSNWGDCNREAPSGGNPCPESQFQSNLSDLQSIKSEIDEASNKIIDILE